LESLLDGFWLRFWTILAPKWSQVGTKIGAQTDINLKTLKSPKVYKTQCNFNDFRVRCVRFESQHRSKILPKTNTETKTNLKAFYHVFAPILLPFWRAQITQIEQKSNKIPSWNFIAHGRRPERLSEAVFVANRHLGL
jgi:hypothetical protein